MPDSLPFESPVPDWTDNYFNYFTDVEEHFRRARGTGLFLLSPLDWALIESWKTSGVPLEAVLKGIDETFEKWRSRKVKRQSINSVAYCTQAVLEAARRMPVDAVEQPRTPMAPFSQTEIEVHLKSAISALTTRAERPLQEIAASVEALMPEVAHYVSDLETLERRLTAIEEKLTATLRMLESDAALASIREALDRELRPYRGKMSSDQLAILERRYIDTALLERAKLPRLSLFYLH